MDRNATRLYVLTTEDENEQRTKKKGETKDGTFTSITEHAASEDRHKPAEGENLRLRKQPLHNRAISPRSPCICVSDREA